MVAAMLNTAGARPDPECSPMRLFLPLTLCLLTGTAQAATGWQAERVNGGVRQSVDGANRSLADGARVDAMAKFSLGNEQAALTLRHGNSRLRTRGPGGVQLFGVDGGDPAVARVQLLDGAVRIDSRDLDLRINAGGLRGRVLDGEAWLSTGRDGDLACVLRGRLELRHGGETGVQTLEQPGECLRLDGQIGTRLLPAAATLNVWLARADGGLNPLSPATVAAGNGAAAAPRDAEMRMPATSAPSTPPPPPAASPAPSRPVPVPVPAATPRPVAPPATAAVVGRGSASGWYVVVGTFAEPARAQRLATRLSARGLHVELLPSAAGRSQRVAIGGHASRDAADATRRRLRGEHPDAWLLHVD